MKCPWTVPIWPVALFALFGCMSRGVSPAAPSGTSTAAAEGARTSGSRTQRQEVVEARAQAASAVLSTAAEELWGEAVEVDAAWQGLEPFGQEGAAGAGAIAVRFRRRASATPFATYYVAPWQNMTEMKPSETLFPQSPPLFAVTSDALIFGPVFGEDDSEAALALRAQLPSLMSRCFAASAKPSSDPPKSELCLPEKLQVMRLEVFPSYVDMEVALPGSGAVDPQSLTNVAPERMLRLTLVPDMGPILRHWIAPERLPDLLESPKPFGDYQPKDSPDSVLDYRPELAERIARLPLPEPEQVAALVRELDKAVASARRNPGRFVEGNVILGADSRQYVPSDEELIAGELGARLEAVLADQEAERGEGGGRRTRKILYPVVEIRHADVMGSGRYFYASAPERREIVVPVR